MPTKETKRKQELRRQRRRRNLIAGAAVLVGLLLVVGIVILLPGAAPQATSTPVANASATLDGKALLQQRCNKCHSASYVTQVRGDATQWADLVHSMVRRGAKLNSQEEQVLSAYLAQTYHQ
jgi:hypothetical protein